MVNNGIVRRIDDLGRVVIPKEIRRNMGLNNGDALEITYTNGTVSIRKYKKSFEECAIEWYNKATNVHDNSDFNFRYFRNADFGDVVNTLSAWLALPFTLSLLVPVMPSVLKRISLMNALVVSPPMPMP